MTWALYWILGTLTDAIVYTVFVIALGASIAYFVIMFRSPKVTSPERTHLRAYISLWIGAVLFWMIYEQASGKMAIFAQSHTNGKMPFFGWTIGPEAYQSVSPAAIVLLAPLVGWFFSRRLGRAIPTVIKFAAAVLIISVSALMLGYGFLDLGGISCVGRHRTVCLEALGACRCRGSGRCRKGGGRTGVATAHGRCHSIDGPERRGCSP